MLDLQNLAISGMNWDGVLLWMALPEERLVVTYSPTGKKTEKKLAYPHEIWDVCRHRDGLWLVTGGGKLGLQLVYWSLADDREMCSFNCPDGAAAGMTLIETKFWIAHRHNRKLFCLDSQTGKVNWVIKTENETFSPAAYKNDLWFIECDPGPLEHWGDTGQGKYFFSRYDPARERIIERVAVKFVPSCMAFDGERFWYCELGKKGFSSTKKHLGQL